MRVVLLFILTFCFSLFAETAELDILKDVTKGMSADQKIEFEKQMKVVNKMIQENMKKSPEERKKMMEEAQKQMNSPEHKKKMKEAMDNLSAKDKEMLQKAMQNISK